MSPENARGESRPTFCAGDATRRALLIGSATGQLSGVTNDIVAIDGLLRDDFQFARENIDIIQEKRATRVGILSAWEQLIKSTGDNDIVVVYYSGHGGFEDVMEAGTTRCFQFIVPYDFEESSDDDFRGIADMELSLLSRQLTAKTRNVTIILDCCHAALMARQSSSTVKAIPDSVHPGAKKHLIRLAAVTQTDGYIPGPGNLFRESNPDAVRVVAAATRGSAYEYTNRQGKRVGVLTESLILSLKGYRGRSRTWASIMNRVRERVALAAPLQQSLVEGPANRKPFSTETVDIEGMLDIYPKDNVIYMNGGRILGIQQGDIYKVLAGDNPPHPELQIALAIVDQVYSEYCSVEIQYCEGQDELSTGSYALPLQKARARWAIALEGDGPFTKRLNEKIEASKFIRMVDPLEDDLPWITGCETLDSYTLFNSEGIPLLRWNGLGVDPNLLLATRPDMVVKHLEKLSRAHHLLRMEGGTNRSALNHTLKLQWGIVEGGQGINLPLQNAELSVNQRVFVSLHNAGPETVYASLFDIGITGNITLLSSASPSGTEILPDRSYAYGSRASDSAWVGQPLGWSSMGSRTVLHSPGQEAIVIIITSAPLDLRCLETNIGRAASLESISGQESSELLRKVNEIVLGGRRDLNGELAINSLRYAVQHIRFFLHNREVA